ncbi:Uncharacterised protein [Klebsiella aerogenes]|nr:Uncharacterised protein [Klebsiella aerogenes]
MGAGDGYVSSAMQLTHNGLYRWILQRTKTARYNGGLPANESENRYWKNSNAVAIFVTTSPQPVINRGIEMLSSSSDRDIIFSITEVSR